MGSRLSQRYWNQDLYYARNAVFEGYIASGVLHVTAMVNGQVLVDGYLFSSGYDYSNSYIDSLGTGTGGIGTYNMGGSYTDYGTALAPVVWYESGANGPGNNIIMPFVNIAKPDGGSEGGEGYIIRQVSSSSFLMQSVWDPSVEGICYLYPQNNSMPTGTMYIGVHFFADGGEGYWGSVREVNDNTVITFNTGNADGGEGSNYQQPDGSYELVMPWVFGSGYDPGLAIGWASVWTNAFYIGP
jgi:hypothetical protein